MENDWSGRFVLLYEWKNEDVWWDFFHWNPLGSYEQFCLSGKLRLFITSQWIWTEKNPTVHLHYFIHRVRQNCQNSHFPFLCEHFLVSFSKFWIWKTVDWMRPHDVCRRFSWKLTEGNVLGKFHIPTGSLRCINKGFRKYQISQIENLKKLNSTDRGALFRHFCKRWSRLRMRTKVVSIFIFSNSFQTKKKKLRLHDERCLKYPQGGPAF